MGTPFLQKLGQKVNIIQFHSFLQALAACIFFLFQRLDVRASENLSDSQIFQLHLF